MTEWNNEVPMQSQTRETAKRRGPLVAQPETPAAHGLRRVAIAIAGFSVLLFGVALVVVPVPGTSIVVIPLGLAILAREFRWARRLLDWSTAAVRRIWAWVRGLFGRHQLGPAVSANRGHAHHRVVARRALPVLRLGT